MRVYVTIFAVALCLLGLLWATAGLWVGDYLGTLDFRRTAFVEIGSFIATSAVVGGLSAAVAEYLRERELRPLRRRAFDRLDKAVSGAIDALKKIMMEGPDASDMAFRKSSGGLAGPVIATRGFKVRMPRRAHSGVIKAMWHRIILRVADIHRVLDRFTAIFSIDRQDDLAVVEQFFDNFRERMNVLAYLLGEQPGGYRSGSQDRDDILSDYGGLRDALNRLAQECGGTSAAAARIDGDIEFLADDIRHVVRAANAMDPDHRSVAGIAIGHDMWFDYETTIEEMDARIVARVPEEVMGDDSWPRAISVWDAIAKYGAQTVDQWKRDFPPPQPPILHVVE